MGGLIGAVDAIDADMSEADAAQPVVEVIGGKAEPLVGIEVASLLESVGVEVDNDDKAAGAEDTERLAEREGGAAGVMKGLAEEGEVDGLVGERNGLDIAVQKVEVSERGIPCVLGTDFDHFLGIIDTGDGFGALGEELGEVAFAGSEICDIDVRHQLQEEMADCLP